MKTRLHPRLVMLGAAPETRGGMAAIVEAYRAHGLFSRWPIEYLGAVSDRGIVEQAKTYGGAVRGFAAALLREPRTAVHVHLSRGCYWRQAAFAGAALAARCPLILQLHGTGFGADARYL